MYNLCLIQTVLLIPNSEYKLNHDKPILPCKLSNRETRRIKKSQSSKLSQTILDRIFELAALRTVMHENISTLV